MQHCQLDGALVQPAHVSQIKFHRVQCISGHHWDEKSLQLQKGISLPVGIPEEGAILFPVINRRWTADQSHVLFYYRLHRNFLVLDLAESSRTFVLF